MAPIVSIVIPTYNRPAPLERLLQRVRDQELQDFECLVVDDGSSPEARDAYGELWRALDGRFQLHLKAADDDRAAGPSCARNRGIQAARGEFIAFCDDDDLWLRNDHLSTAVRALRQHGADLMIAGMQVAADGKIAVRDRYAVSRKYLTAHPLENDIYEVPIHERARFLKRSILSCNTVVARRGLVVDCGMFWERISMAEDRDFGYRLLDKSERMLFRDVTVAEYDISPRPSLYNSYAEREVPLFAIIAGLHALHSISHREIRRVVRANRAWWLLELAQYAALEGNIADAREFGLESFLLNPTASALRLLLKWKFRRSSAPVTPSRGNP